MKIISSYVREQQRYTKKQLCRIFSFDENDAEKFITNLKSYGIMKTVANSVEQRELTDLIDEDVKIVGDGAGNDDCLYVFAYVGIITIGNRIIKIFPKYISLDSEPLIQMKQVIKVLERYSHSEEQIINLFNGDGDNRAFNILAIILYLLNDYFENGVYNNTEDILEVNGNGEISWGRTINDCFTIIEEERPYYVELITQKVVENEADYFKRLHECILTDCSKQLRSAGLEDLFELEDVYLSEEDIDAFGDREFILESIRAELNIQFNTHRQIILKTMYTYVSQDRRMIEESKGLSMFGTTAFHVIWENVCSDVFGNKLNVPIGQLGMKHPVCNGYNRRSKLIELIEKPKWQGIDTIKEAKDTLIPDLISVFKHENEDWLIIFDAKYYSLQLEQERPLRGNPGISDIIKQYLYHLAYKKFVLDHQISVVKNCFLMPTEQDEIIDKGIARIDMLSELGLEDIQIRLIPARKIFDCYLSRKKIAIELLRL